MLLPLLSTLLVTNFVFCHHPIKNLNEIKSNGYGNNAQLSHQPQYNVQIESQPKEDCNPNQPQGQQQQQQGQQQPLNPLGAFPYPFVPYPQVGVNSPLPPPILNNYVDSRYVNVLPPLPTVVDLSQYVNPNLPPPILPQIPGQLNYIPQQSQNNPQSNDLQPLNVPQFQQSSQFQRPLNTFANPLPQQASNSFSGSVPFGQDRTFIRQGLEVIYQWKYIDWVYPNIQLTGKNFTLGNPLTQDVDIDVKRGRVFATTPSWLSGVPITLSTISQQSGPGGLLLQPYPNWQWHKVGCDGLTSVYRVAIDECDRMWLVDTGSTGADGPICPSKIVIFDLNTDKPILIYQIPESQTVERTASYVNPVVEIGDTCADAFLYVADVLKHGLLVYSLRENRSWRLNNTPGNAFGNDPEAGSLNIAGETFSLTDGTLGMSLSPRGFFPKRYLYFNSLSSFYHKFADADSLKRSYLYDPIIYQSIQKSISQAGVQATSRTGATFFQLAQFTALACWNIERPFTPENIVLLARDEVTLQYISGIKIKTNKYGDEELWFNTNRIQKTINKSRKIDEVNFRFIRGNVNELIKGTRCEPTGYRGIEPSMQGWKRV